MKKKTYFFAGLLFVILLLSRLVPHPANFTALAGVGLFAGSLFSKRPIGFLLPLAAVFLTDLYFGIYPGAAFTYFAIIAIVAIAPSLKSSFLKIGGSALLAAVLFFVVSNFGVWLQSGLYELSYAGLVDCYVRAIPFFRNTLASTLFYSFIFYGSYSLIASEKEAKGFFSLANGRQKR